VSKGIISSSVYFGFCRLQFTSGFVDTKFSGANLVGVFFVLN